MELREVLEIIDGKMVSTDVNLTQEVWLGGGADLMSDLLAFGQEGMLLMTGLTNPQVVRTAEMAGVAAIVLGCRCWPRNTQCLRRAVVCTRPVSAPAPFSRQS
jgi:hypothetical protein